MIQKTTHHQEFGDYAAIDALIAGRLGERQRKLDRMAEMERDMARERARMRPFLFPFAAAAGIAAIFVWFQFTSSRLSPWDELGLDRPALTAYRSASGATGDIDRLIDDGRYGQALDITAEALRESDRQTAAALAAIGEYGDDESAGYTLQAERSFNSELRWTYIYLLVQTGDYRAAKAEIRQYLQEARYEESCGHKAEAARLLEKLKK